MGLHGFQILEITDGTTTVNLLNPRGFFCTSWDPATTAAKGDGTWADSPVADGRKLKMRRATNVIEGPLEIQASGLHPDELIHITQDLRRLLEKAANYSPNEWSTDCVWIKAQGLNETNPRYAIIEDYRAANDRYPYSNQDNFWNLLGKAAFPDWILGLEREPHWRNIPPGEDVCVPIAGYSDWCWPYYIEFDGDTTILNCGSPAKLDDLPDFAVAGKGPITVDGWIRADSYGEGNIGRIVDKGSILFTVHNTHGLFAAVACAGQVAYAGSGTDEFLPDGLNHHVLMCYDETGADTPAARTIYLAIDGVWVGSYSVWQPSIGNYTSDAAVSLIIGNDATTSWTFDGSIGWMRVSNIVRFPVGLDFDPPDRCKMPESDANTMWLGIQEGQGTTIYDLSATPSNGTLANGSWDCDCGPLFGNVLGDCGPAYLNFNGADSIVNCGSGAMLDDLPDNAVAGRGQITAQALIRADSYGGTGQGTIIGKQDGAQTVGLTLRVQNTFGLEGIIRCANIVGISRSGEDEFIPDGLWHHVLMTYSETGAGLPAARTIYLAIDGVWVTSYTIQQVSNGFYASDAAQDLLIGNLVNTLCFDGDIGWVKVSDAILYSPAGGNFTPEPRCELPTIDANTVLQVIYEGQGIVTHDRSGNGNDGAITLAPWGCDCEIVSGYSGEVLTEVTLEPTCENEVFVANKHNKANITNVHWWDNSANAWSANLQNGAFPIPLLPAIPGVNDAVYFGCDTTILDSGPFCSVVLDLIAQTDITGITWEYWNGAAWVAFGGAYVVQDNTNADGNMTGVAFDTDGVGSVHFGQGAMVTTNPNPGVALGITGYWIRARVTAVGAAPTPPIQQNRRVYSITWPFVEVQSEDVVGDVSALARFLVENVSTYTSPLNNRNLARLIFGVRKTSRGEDFTAYLNLADEQNPSGVTVTDTGAGAFAAGDSPTGRVYQIAFGGAVASSEMVRITLSSAVAKQYVGKFRCFIRPQVTAGLIGNVLLSVEGYSAAAQFFDSGNLTLPTNSLIGIDCGEFTVPSMLFGHSSDTLDALYISVYVGSLAALTIELVDIILIPSDEYLLECDYISGPFPTSATQFANYHLDVDGTIVSHKFGNRVITRNISNTNIVGLWRPIGLSPVVVNANEKQRIWLFTALTDESPEGTDFLACHKVQMRDVHRYISMRGSR